ncbi:hypothetical protein NKH98_20200 [Mesorhizobium sp. M0833]|uniref:hypothetical protein n=2 Tax=unclassified Mesorhizobium TaxID=325217 RepID=UPI003335A07B
MATIPLQLAQRRLDAGNVLSYPEGSPVGRAMQGFGDELSAVAERYQQQKQQEEAFDADLARRRFNGQIGQAEDEVVANAPADGSGLHDTMYGQVDPRTGRMIKTGLFDTLFADALPKMPESQRANFARQKEALREAGSLRMAARQLQRRDEYEQAEWTKVDNISTSAIAQSNPKDTENFDAIRQNGFDLIAKIGNPLARQAAAVAWRGNTAKALVQAMIAQDPKRAAEVLGAAQAGNRTKDDTTEVVGGSSAFGVPNAAAAKGDRVGMQTLDERLAQAFRDDLPQQEQAALIRQAQAANIAQQVEFRTNIGLAEQNAPGAIAQTGAYSGKMPGRDAFIAVYGVEEGGKQYGDFARKIDVGRQAFGMRTMPNQAIHAALRDAEPGPAGSQGEQARYHVTAAAALQTLDARRTDPAAYVRKVFPSVDAAWSEITTPDSESWNREGGPDTYDRGTYVRAIAASVAAQKQLGIENYQPFPWSVLKNIATTFKDGSVPQADKHTILYSLVGGASDPEVRAALSQQLVQAGLPQSVESQPARPVVAPVIAGKQNQPPAPSNRRKPQSKLELAAEDFGNYLTEGFEGLGRAPHDIGLFLQDLRDDPLDALSQLPVTSASGLAAEGSLAFESLGQAVAKGLAIVRAGTGKFAKPLEELTASGSRATSELAVEGAAVRQTTEVESRAINAAKEAAYLLSTGVKPDKAELLAIIKSIARDPSKIRHPGASFGKALSKNYRKTFLDANPNLKGEVVVHHAAEQQIWTRYPSLVAEDEMHSLQNLRGIPKGLDNLLHKIVFRFEWDKFYASHPQPTRQQVLDYVTYIDKQYGHLFNPPIGE